jgi:hypothetical protein
MQQELAGCGKINGQKQKREIIWQPEQKNKSQFFRLILPRIN